MFVLFFILWLDPEKCLKIPACKQDILCRWTNGWAGREGRKEIPELKVASREGRKEITELKVAIREGRKDIPELKVASRGKEGNPRIEGG